MIKNIINSVEQGAGSIILNEDGTIPSNLIPNISVIDFLGTVANESQMLAKIGQKGDWVIRSDDGKVYVITGDTPSNLSSWTALSYPVAAGLVAHKSSHAIGGSDVLTPADIGAYASSNPSNYVTATQTGTLSSAFITPTQTGQFYASSNPNGYATTGNLANLIVTKQIGINVSSPVSKVHISGENAITISGDSNQYVAVNMTVGNGANLQIGANGNLAGQLGTVTSHPLIFNTNSSEQMRLTANGTLGIGIGAPSSSYKVDAWANSNAVGGIRIVNQNAGTNAQTIFQVGNDQNAAAAAVRLNSSTNTAQGGGNALSLINGLNAPLLLSTNGTEKVRVLADGKVGIGTSEPASRLHINGDLTISGATTATSATAGSQALPANPAGFLVVSINGTSCKIPYYL